MRDKASSIVGVAMGKDDWKNRRSAGRAGAVADKEYEESAVSDLAPDAGERGLRELPPSGGARPRFKTARAGGPGGFGKIYKPGQGYYIRVGTATGAAVLILAGTGFVYEKLSDLLTSGTSYYFPVLY